MGANHPQRVMPQVDDDIVNVWRTVGVCKSVGMGIFPIDWQDLHSYYSIVGNKLSEWQSEQVVLMSRAYCNAGNFYSSNKPQKPPYERQYTIEEQREIGLGLQKQLLDMGFQI